MKEYINKYVEVTRKEPYLGNFIGPCRGIFTYAGFRFGEEIYEFYSNDISLMRSTEIEKYTYKSSYKTTISTWITNYKIKILE